MNNPFSIFPEMLYLIKVMVIPCKGKGGDVDKDMMGVIKEE
jgi:hypothetical protein